MNRPDSINGASVPYDADVSTLRALAAGGAPDCWGAFAALSHRTDRASWKVLVEFANQVDPYVRRAAIEALGRHMMGSASTDVLLSALEDSHEYVVAAACRAVADLKLPRARPHLRTLLQHDSEPVRQAALRALADFASPDDFAATEHVFRTTASQETRRAAAWTLRALASNSNWSTLVDLWLEDELPRHRLWACELLAEFSAGAERPALLV